MKLRLPCMLIGFLSFALSISAQTSSSSPVSTQVPPLIQLSNIATDEGGNSLSGVVTITFSLYNTQQGSEPLWTETHTNVQLDPTGHYSVQLGISSSTGIPTTLFTSGEARWLGVRIAEQPEQSRVLLLSVPYALKAGDAATIGGLPPSAFVLAAPGTTLGASAPATFVAAPADAPPATNVTGSGTANYIPLWTTISNIADSVLFQTGSGSTANVGINTTTPANTLDVNGTATIRGTLSLPSKGTATASGGFNSRALTLAASAFNSSTGKAANQSFQWLAQPAGNDTSSPSGTLNLLFAEGSSPAVQTGFLIASNGQVTFAPGQTFPGTGNGTITGVTAGTDLTGGGTIGNVTLNVDTTKVAQLAAANTFTGNQTVSGNLSATGVVTGSSFEIGSNLFGFGSYANRNAFLGFAGNSTMTGVYNTATGYGALGLNTTGSENTAMGGFGALAANTTGNYNVAVGWEALYLNTSGYYNTALGYSALNANTTGYNNTAAGDAALISNTTGSDNTATGVGALYANTQGVANVASGESALASNTIGVYNTASGYRAMWFNTTGYYNDASGADALYSNSTGAYNAASGYQALYFNTTGQENAAFGAGALFSLNSGSENTAVGAYALFDTPSGTDLTCVGYDCIVAAPNLHNATAIGAHASINVSDAVVLGSVAGVNGATATTRVGIGTTSPTNLLTLGKGFGPSIADGWTSYSSRRWKTNIQPLHNALGMVEKLRGVSYDLKDSDKHEIGVIAEEVGAVVPEVVTYEENGKDARGVDYSRLTALLIEAMKQQQKQIAIQETQIQKQQRVMSAQAAAIRKQQQQLSVHQSELSRLRQKIGALEATSNTLAGNKSPSPTSSAAASSTAASRIRETNTKPTRIQTSSSE